MSKKSKDIVVQDDAVIEKKKELVLSNKTNFDVVNNLDTNELTTKFENIDKFAKLVKKKMVPAIDFGTIPGTKKPSLLKPGAEKLCMLFGVSPRFEVLDKIIDHRAEVPYIYYEMKCILVHNGTGNIVGEGVGSSNSREKKNGKANPYDIANTILKMAKKRAHVDATLQLASVSNVFTQDTEDLPAGTKRSASLGVSMTDKLSVYGFGYDLWTELTGEAKSKEMKDKVKATIINPASKTLELSSPMAIKTKEQIEQVKEAIKKITKEVLNDNTTKS